MSITVHKISRSEVEKYKREVEKTSGLLSLLQESFEFEYSTYEGVVQSDIQTIRGCTSDPQLKQLFDENPLVGRGGAKHSDKSVVNDNGYTKAFFAFRKGSDGTYDIIYCTAKQTRTINWEKIGCTTAIATGVAAGAAVLIPGVGLVLGAVIVAGTAGATAAVGGAAGAIQKNFTEMPNVIMGYIGKELQSRNLLQLVD